MANEQLDEDEIRRAKMSGHPLRVAWVIYSIDDDPEELEALRVGLIPPDQVRENHAKAALLRRIREGELRTIGVVETHLMGGEVWGYVRPSICRLGAVDWDRNTITEGPHNFRKVRVYEPETTIPVVNARGAAGEIKACTDVLVDYALSRSGWDGALNKDIYAKLNSRLLEKKKSGQSNKSFMDDRTWRNRRIDARKILETMGKPIPSRWPT